MPEELPTNGYNAADFVGVLGEANRMIARFDVAIQGMLNPDIFITPLATQEAVSSSNIEGTQTNVDDIYDHEAGVNFSDRTEGDVREVLNYRSALKFSAENVQDRPISKALVREMHRILLQGVRGEHRTPGSFRTVQNWIGRMGHGIEEAIYVPPNPAFVEMLMDNWLDYVVNYREIDPLVQAAIMHVQFEMIHPFLDGNGRMGRLLIPLFLHKVGVLHRPFFYMSAFLEANRREYYACLNGVHENKDWGCWIAFFLRGIIAQATDNLDRISSISRLYDECGEKLREITHSASYPLIRDAIFELPSYTMPVICRRIREKSPNCKESTLRHLMHLVAESGLVSRSRKSSGRKPALFRFTPLYDIMRSNI